MKTKKIWILTLVLTACFMFGISSALVISAQDTNRTEATAMTGQFLKEIDSTSTGWPSVGGTIETPQYLRDRGASTYACSFNQVAGIELTWTPA